MEFGGVGAAVADFDGDGCSMCSSRTTGRARCIATISDRRFVDVTKSAGLLFEQHATTPSWGDYDNDGRPDLYVAGFLVNVTHYPDHLFHNGGASAHPRFQEMLPALVNEHDASHGVQWVDFDGDGALDLALANNDPGGGHYLFRNVLPPAQARQSLAIDVVDARRPSYEAGRGGPRLRSGHASADLVGPGRHRRRLLLAERHAGACRDRWRPESGCRGDGDVGARAPDDEAAGVDPKTAHGPLVVRVP